MHTNRQSHCLKSTTTIIYLGLGSNLTNELGTPIDHIATAVRCISEHAQISNVHTSSFYVSEPYGVTDQPEFINAVVRLETDLTPYALLDFCQSLETRAKRERLRHWGERSLDVDILIYGNESYQNKDLTIPHAELFKRNFVLVPLAEIAPDLHIHGKAISNIPLSQDWTGLKLINS